jgi:hypothetical protein
MAAYGPQHPVKARVVAVLRTRGLRGVLDVTKQLTAAADPEGCISQQALVVGLRAGGLAIAAADAKDLFEDLDEQSNGRVPLLLVIR